MPTYVLLGQQKLGPYTDAEILASLDDGTLSSDSLCWREGMPDWKSLSSVFAGFAEFLPQRPRATKPQTACNSQPSSGDPLSSEEEGRNSNAEPSSLDTGTLLMRVPYDSIPSPFRTSGLTLADDLGLGGGQGREILIDPQDIASLVNSAHSGNARAQEQLGLIYLENAGKERDSTKASDFRSKADKWFSVAAAQGAAGAAFQLGEIRRLEGEDGPRQALELFRQAADAGDANAQYELGKCYQIGSGVVQSAPKAEALFHQALQDNHPGATYELGEKARQEGRIDESLALFRRVIVPHGNEGLQGDLNFSMALAFLDERGSELNPPEALRWMKEAIEKNHLGANGLLGWAYDFSGLKPPFEFETVDWLRLAAEQGEPGPQYSLGVCCFRGRGVRKNGDEGIVWLRKAAAQGHREAEKLLQNTNGDGAVEMLEQIFNRTHYLSDEEGEALAIALENLE